MTQSPQTEKPVFKFTSSRQFRDWLAEEKLSLAFTTYQAGKLFFVGTKPDGELSLFERTFNRCMGLHVSGDSLYMNGLYQTWRFENVLQPGELQDGFDRLYVPQVAWTTGDVDSHDISLDTEGKPVFVNTLFSCLARVSEQYSFEPFWKPPFISKLAAEDRCHLNGLAMEDGVPRYVTAVSRSDVTDGWRDRRQDSGVVIDVASSEVVCEGLSMPHSPRMYQGKLWLLNSGQGQFGYVDLQNGQFESIAFCPGYARGLSFHGDFAIIGLSKPRHDTFSGLPLDEALKKHDAEPRCGLHVINLKTGDTVHFLHIEGVVEELYDVVTLPGVVRPKALGLKTGEIRRTISTPPSK